MRKFIVLSIVSLVLGSCSASSDGIKLLTCDNGSLLIYVEISAGGGTAACSRDVSVSLTIDPDAGSFEGITYYNASYQTDGSGTVTSCGIDASSLDNRQISGTVSKSDNTFSGIIKEEYALKDASSTTVYPELPINGSFTKSSFSFSASDTYSPDSVTIYRTVNASGTCTEES